MPGFVSLVFKSVILAVLYVAFGKLGIALGVGPNLITPVWPPSGLALAAFILYGRSSLPGLIAGSLWMNISSMFYLSGHNTPALVGALEQTVGSVSQFMLAGWILKPVIRNMVFKGVLKQSFLFTLIVCLCCVIAASVGMFTFWQLKLMSNAELTYGWLVWWVGDCAGMLVFAPLILWALHPTIRTALNACLAFPIVNMGIGFTLMMTLIVGHLERGQRLDAFEAQSKLLSITLQNHIDMVLKDLKTVRLLYFKADIQEDEFRYVTSPLLKQSPWLLRFSWLPLVNESDRKAFERAASAPITERTIDGMSKPASSRLEYFPVAWADPKAGSETIGTDESVDAYLAPALLSARDTGSTRFTSLIKARNGISANTSALVGYEPVSYALPAATVPYHPDLIRGFVSVVLDPQTLLAASMEEVNLVDQHVVLGDPGAPHTAWVGTGNVTPSEGMRLLTSNDKLVFQYGVSLGNQHWRLAASPVWINDLRPSWLQMGILGSGISFTTVLAAFVFMRRKRELDLMAAKADLEAEVERRTASLEKTNDSLLEEIDRRNVLEQELRTARAEADNANQAKSVFLANMSHEIRTPLNAVLGYTQLLLEDHRVDSETRQKLSTILAAGQRLLRLINDILDLSKIESGSLQVVNEHFDLNRETREIAALFAGKAERKHLRFEVSIELPAPALVNGDKLKTGQMLGNLLGNAIKFTDAGGVTLHVYRDGDLVCMDITDTGPGMNVADADALFRPFRQDTQGLEKGGSGLGLSLCKKMALAMGGDLQLFSQPGEGLTARLTLLLAPLQGDAGQDDSGASRLLHEGVTLQDDCHCHALVVEDDDLSRDVLAQALQNAGCQIYLANNGLEALEILETSPVDIVFSDIRMPLMNGVELMDRIKANPVLASIPVVAVTASSLEHERRFYVEKGFIDFVSKPYIFGSIYQMLSKYANVRFKTSAPDAEPNQTADNPDVQVLVSHEARALLEQLRQAAETGQLTQVRRLRDALAAAGFPAAWLATLDEALQSFDFDHVVIIVSTLLDAPQTEVQ
ncbi:response regulator [Leeia oryzae]|uniref:response regulator n=1 Tax=Leeia oryzae TaxID=356662 RepID=UPI000380E24E|nr:response regulator [Leeia oryzae]